MEFLVGWLCGTLSAPCWGLGLGRTCWQHWPRLWRVNSSVDCVCVYAHICMHVCACSCVGQRSVLGIFFSFGFFV